MYFIKCKKGVAVCSNLCSESYAYILLLFNENFYYYLYLIYYLFLQFLKKGIHSAIRFTAQI